MKVYLLCENIDLGYGVVDVYSSLDKIPHELQQCKSYSYLGTPKQVEHVITGCWDVINAPGYPKRNVYEYEVI